MNNNTPCSPPLRNNLTNVLWRRTEDGFLPMVGVPDEEGGGIRWIDIQRATYAQATGENIGARKIVTTCGTPDCYEASHLRLSEETDAVFGYYAERIALDQLWSVPTAAEHTPAPTNRAERRHRDRRRRR